jgi:uncharacterized membrane protein YdjX (TVP38/TMEM64 family)
MTKQKILLVLIGLWLLFWWFLPFINSPEVRALVERSGIFGPILIITYIVFSHVFAPVAGTPGVFLGITVYGSYKTMFYLYIAGLISAAISFFISRRFGRSLVFRLIEKKNIHKVDEFTESFGTEVLIISRLFGFSFFDVISYAAGLTKMKFVRYFIITALFSIPSKVLYAYILGNESIPVQIHFVIWIVTLFIGGVVFLYVFRRLVKRNKDNPQS